MRYHSTDGEKQRFIERIESAGGQVTLDICVDLHGISDVKSIVEIVPLIPHMLPYATIVNISSAGESEKRFAQEILAGLQHIQSLDFDHPWACTSAKPYKPTNDEQAHFISRIGLAGGQVTQSITLELRAVRDSKALVVLLAEVPRCLPELTGIDLSSSRRPSSTVTDDVIRYLAALLQLEYLDLSGSRITNNGLSAIRQLTGLTRLYLGRTEVTAEGISSLSPLAKLHTLTIPKAISMRDLQALKPRFPRVGWIGQN